MTLEELNEMRTWGKPPPVAEEPEARPFYLRSLSASLCVAFSADMAPLG